MNTHDQNIVRYTPNGAINIAYYIEKCHAERSRCVHENMSALFRIAGRVLSDLATSVQELTLNRPGFAGDSIT